MSLSDSIAELKHEILTVEKECIALQLGKKASASRVRKSLQNIKTKSHGMRKDITLYSKEMPTKSRKPKTPAVETPVVEVSDNKN
jgi:hypothetical protein